MNIVSTLIKSHIYRGFVGAWIYKAGICPHILYRVIARTAQGKYNKERVLLNSIVRMRE